jgi:hypothetical protein
MGSIFRDSSLLSKSSFSQSSSSQLPPSSDILNVIARCVLHCRASLC